MTIPAADDVDADDDFGDFTGIPSSVDQTVVPVGGATFGVFDAIQSIKDLPLPSLDATAIPAANDVDPDDDFGHFTGIPNSVDRIVVTDDDATFGAFDGIQPIEDQPLPSLDAMTIPTAYVDADDDFGDFTCTPSSVDPTVMPGAFDRMQPIEDQPLPSREAMEIPAIVTDDVVANDDFGEFTGVPSSADHGVDPACDATFGAFDGIQPIRDQPLPSLNAMASSALVADDGDFGDFTGIPRADDRMVISVDDSPCCAFDGIEPIENQSLPSLVAIVPPTVTGAVDGDGFGDFRGIPETNDITGTKHAPPAGDVDRSLPMQDSSSAPDVYVVGFSGLSHIAETVGGTPDAVDGISPVEDRPLPSHQTCTNPSLMSAASVDQLLPHLSSSTNPAVNENVGAFETLVSIEGNARAALDVQSGSLEAGNDQLVVCDPSHFNGSPAPLPSLAGMEPMPPSLSQEVSVDQASSAHSDPFSFFNTVDEGLSDRQLQPLSSYRFVTTLDQQAQDLPNDDFFGDFMAPTEVPWVPAVADSVVLPTSGQVSIGADAPNSLPEPAFAGHISAGLKLVEGPTLLEELSDGNAFSTLEKPLTQRNLFDDSAPLPGVVRSEAEPSDDDDDWGDFEHVQAPSVPADKFPDFIVEPGPPKDSMVGSMTTAEPLPVEFDAFTSFPPETGEQTAVASAAVDFEANFAAFDDVHSAPQSVKATQAEADFGEWDSFQDASPNVLVRPMSLDEIKIQLISITFPGSLARIDLAKQLKENIFSKSWTSGYRSNSQSSLKRAKRCLDVVSVLTTSCSNLVCSDWNRVLSAVRDEMSMGSFLLKEAKKLPKGSHKDVLKPLSIMVSGLSEFVRVARSIVATVGDVLCLDLQVPLSTHGLASDWQSLGMVQLSLEVEDAWTGIEAISKALKLCVSSRLETIETIRKKAIESENTSLCQLTLQPLSHEDSTVNEVIWEGKPFMACAANLWSHRVSDRVPNST